MEPSVVPGPRVVPGPCVTSKSPVPPEPSVVTSMQAGRPVSRTRMVSPKVARLMRAPRRKSQSIERNGLALARANAHERFPSEDDLAVGGDLYPSADPVLGIDEVDVEAEVYERSL
jgi:hypothetical protein